MREEIIRFGDKKKLVGIYTYPAPYEKKDINIVFINAGFVHRVGPQRYYVKISRILSEIGFGCFRMDLPGIGDSEHINYEVANNSRETNYLSIVTAMDCLESSFNVKKFFLFGFCSGANSAFNVAILDFRVKGVISVNDIFIENPEIYNLYFEIANKRLKYRYYKRHVFSLSRWRKLLTGNSRILSFQGIANKVFMKIRKENTPHRKDGIKKVPKISLTPWIELLKRNTDILYVFSEGSMALDFYELIFSHDLQQIKTSNKISIDIIKGSDHNFTTIDTQNILTDKIISWTNEVISNHCEKICF